MAAFTDVFPDAKIAAAAQTLNCDECLNTAGKPSLEYLTQGKLRGGGWGGARTTDVSSRARAGVCLWPEPSPATRTYWCSDWRWDLHVSAFNREIKKKLTKAQVRAASMNELVILGHTGQVVLIFTTFNFSSVDRFYLCAFVLEGFISGNTLTLFTGKFALWCFFLMVLFGLSGAAGFVAVSD